MLGRILASLFVLQFAVNCLPGQSTAPDTVLRYRLTPQTTVEERLSRYKGDDRKREAALKQMFIEAGCDDSHITEQAVKHAKLPNVICILPGSASRTIIVGAHFDHVDAGSGVVDNWSGASLLPSLFEAVKSQPRSHTYIFIGFTDEEKGEVGSHYYARQMTADEVAGTDAMVNMDTLGVAPTAIWASHSDQRLTAMLYAMGRNLQLPVTSINVDQIGSTDSEQFRAVKIPSITIHSLTQQAFNDRVLHSPHDRMEAIHLSEYYDSYKLIAGYLADLDQLGRANPRQ